MTYTPAIRTAVQLTAEARAAQEILEDQFLLSAWLPSRENYGLSFEFDINALSLADAATYRAFDTEAPYGTTPGSQSRSGKLPPISRKLRVSEYDQLFLYGQTDALGDKFEQYARRLGGGIAGRVALAQGQAVEAGAVTIAENGLVFTIDFGRKAGHTITAAALWSIAATDAFNDLVTWRGVFVATNGTAPGVAMMSTAVLSALQKNTSIIRAALGRGSDLPSIISVDQVRAVFDSYGFGRIVINDDQVSVNGTPTRVTSANRFLFLPETGGVSLTGDGGALGGTDWGIPSEAINPTYGIPDGDRPGIFSAAFHSADPEGHNILASAIVLPVAANANATLSAAVLA